MKTDTPGCLDVKLAIIAKDPAPWKTVYLDHISYAVSDYRRSTAFYRDLMGWTIANESQNGNQCTMNIGSIGLVACNRVSELIAAA